jgi:hypothetical protein
MRATDARWFGGRRRGSWVVFFFRKAAISFKQEKKVRNMA